MAEPHRGIGGTSVRHHCAEPGQPCVYDLAVRQAIATQHRLGDTGRMDLSACDECGQPYLLQELWQPLSEEGELACPRCGTIVASWDGARSYVAYCLRLGSTLGTR